MILFNDVCGSFYSVLTDSHAKILNHMDAVSEMPWWFIQRIYYRNIHEIKLRSSNQHMCALRISRLCKQFLLSRFIMLLQKNMDIMYEKMGSGKLKQNYLALDLGFYPVVVCSNKVCRFSCAFLI